jgi:hypothetical protein
MQNLNSAHGFIHHVTTQTLINSELPAEPNPPSTLLAAPHFLPRRTLQTRNEIPFQSGCFLPYSLTQTMCADQIVDY